MRGLGSSDKRFPLIFLRFATPPQTNSPVFMNDLNSEQWIPENMLQIAGGKKVVKGWGSADPPF